MPGEHEGEWGDVKRGRQDHQLRLIDTLQATGGDGEDQVGCANQLRGHAPVRQADGDVAALAKGGQRALDFRGAAATHFQQDMGPGEIGRQVERAADRQAVAIHQAGKPFLEQWRRAQLVGQFGKHPGGQVDITVEHAFQHAFATGVADLQVDARSLTAQGTDQARQDKGRAVVGHRQAEPAFG
ncbi:hypothetical protein D3C78_1348530 [compost metagenome]